MTIIFSTSFLFLYLFIYFFSFFPRFKMKRNNLRFYCSSNAIDMGWNIRRTHITKIWCIICKSSVNVQHTNQNWICWLKSKWVRWIQSVYFFVHLPLHSFFTLPLQIFTANFLAFLSLTFFIFFRIIIVIIIGSCQREQNTFAHRIVWWIHEGITLFSQ